MEEIQDDFVNGFYCSFKTKGSEENWSKNAEKFSRIQFMRYYLTVEH